ncbi:MAG TPA: glycosyltransferase family 4 protein [Stellaceae bacterium]|nr:glycosyltransferase family 4 protein [Stellaceae bacterium]
MTPLTFIVAGRLDQLTGGYLFDRHVVDALIAAGRGVALRELEGRFPEPDDTAYRAAAAALTGIADGAAAVIDGLALAAFAPCLGDAAAAGVKLVGFVHHPLALETGLSLAQREGLALAEARLLPRLRGVLCPSEMTAWHMAEYGVARDRILVTPPGTKPARMRGAARREGPLRLLCVASITPRKGHLLLIEALAELKDRPWHLTCIGSLSRDPATALALEQAIARHDLGERVLLAGEWPPARLGAAYAEADVFVLPSYHEGYGMAFAEALAHGLPIIGTTAGAIPETVPVAAALLVPPGDRAALLRALRMVLDNDGLRAQLAAAAAKAGAALPDWPEATRRWIEGLDRLLT